MPKTRIHGGLYLKREIGKRATTTMSMDSANATADMLISLGMGVLFLHQER